MENKDLIWKVPKEVLEYIITNGSVSSSEGKIDFCVLNYYYEIIDREKGLVKMHFFHDLPNRLKEIDKNIRTDRNHENKT